MRVCTSRRSGRVPGGAAGDVGQVPLTRRRRGVGLQGVVGVKRSTDRMLTTHSGSLPRPPELVQLLAERADGSPVDQAELAALIGCSVGAAVRQQVEAGIAVVNDGEHSKVSYSGYLKDRLNGFEELEQ